MNQSKEARMMSKLNFTYIVLVLLSFMHLHAGQNEMPILKKENLERIFTKPNELPTISNIDDFLQDIQNLNEADEQILAESVWASESLTQLALQGKEFQERYYQLIKSISPKDDPLWLLSPDLALKKEILKELSLQQDRRILSLAEAEKMAWNAIVREFTQLQDIDLNELEDMAQKNPLYRQIYMQYQRLFNYYSEEYIEDSSVNIDINKLIKKLLGKINFLRNQNINKSLYFANTKSSELRINFTIAGKPNWLSLKDLKSIEIIDISTFLLSHGFDELVTSVSVKGKRFSFLNSVKLQDLNRKKLEEANSLLPEVKKKNTEFVLTSVYENFNLYKVHIGDTYLYLSLEQMTYFWTYIIKEWMFFGSNRENTLDRFLIESMERDLYLDNTKEKLKKMMSLDINEITKYIGKNLKAETSVYIDSTSELISSYSSDFGKSNSVAKYLLWSKANQGIDPWRPKIQTKFKALPSWEEWNKSLLTNSTTSNTKRTKAEKGFLSANTRVESLLSLSPKKRAKNEFRDRVISNGVIAIFVSIFFNNVEFSDSDGAGEASEQQEWSMQESSHGPENFSIQQQSQASGKALFYLETARKTGEMPNAVNHDYAADLKKYEDYELVPKVEIMNYDYINKNIKGSSVYLSLASVRFKSIENDSKYLYLSIPTPDSHQLMKINYFGINESDMNATDLSVLRNKNTSNYILRYKISSDSTVSEEDRFYMTFQFSPEDKHSQISNLKLSAKDLQKGLDYLKSQGALELHSALIEKLHYGKLGHGQQTITQSLSLEDLETIFFSTGFYTYEANNKVYFDKLLGREVQAKRFLNEEGVFYYQCSASNFIFTKFLNLVIPKHLSYKVKTIDGFSGIASDARIDFEASSNSSDAILKSLVSASQGHRRTLIYNTNQKYDSIILDATPIRSQSNEEVLSPNANANAKPQKNDLKVNKPKEVLNFADSYQKLEQKPPVAILRRYSFSIKPNHLKISKIINPNSYSMNASALSNETALSSNQVLAIELKTKLQAMNSRLIQVYKNKNVDLKVQKPAQAYLNLSSSLDAFVRFLNQQISLEDLLWSTAVKSASLEKADESSQKDFLFALRNKSEQEILHMISTHYDLLFKALNEWNLKVSKANLSVQEKHFYTQDAEYLEKIQDLQSLVKNSISNTKLETERQLKCAAQF